MPIVKENIRYCPKNIAKTSNVKSDMNHPYVYVWRLLAWQIDIYVINTHVYTIYNMYVTYILLNTCNIFVKDSCLSKFKIKF